jgi:hypothetical protein
MINTLRRYLVQCATVWGTIGLWPTVQVECSVSYAYPIRDRAPTARGSKFLL